MEANETGLHDREMLVYSSVEDIWPEILNIWMIIPDKKPCVVPALEHGKFHGVVSDLADDNRFNVAFQDFDTVQSGEMLTILCENGYIANVSVTYYRYLKVY